MKYCFLFFLALFAGAVNAQSTYHTAIYALKYYYPEQPEKIISKRAYNRSVNKDGSFCITDYNAADVSKSTGSNCYDANGIPTQSGNDKFYRDSLRINFRGKDTTILMKAERLKDPTTLWFWKLKPKVNETDTVAGMRKNFITKSIDLVSVAYTYIGKESIEVSGKMKTCYLVKSHPLNGSTGVFDERWFDDEGMLVKEKHTVGKDGTRIAELTDIIK